MLKKNTNIKATKSTKKNSLIEFMIALIIKKITTASKSIEKKG